MEVDGIESVFQEFIMLALSITAPILIITFIAAVAIGVIQSMMQIQEQTLSFTPKIIIVAVLIFFMASPMFERIIESIQDAVRLAPQIF